MQNDDKRTSRDDETFPHEAEADAAHDEDLTSPETPPASAAEQGDAAAKSISFSKTAHIGGQGPLDATFGMPDFDFPDGAKTSERDAEEEAENAMLAAKESLDLPLETGTGWESVGSIERPESMRGRRRRDSGADATLGGFGDSSSTSSPAQRSQATVMPFPGGGFSRSSEPTPVDMLRGSGANSSSLDDLASGAEEQAEPTPEFDAAAQDTLADAVQSALRNVYGGQVSERPDDHPEQGGYTVADTLMGGTNGRERDGEALWPEANAGWQQQSEGNDDYLETERERGAAEANTEAVLDYLYGQRRAEKRENTVLSADSSLRDFGEAAGYSRDWQDPHDFDDRPAAPQPSLRDPGGAYRGGPQQRYVEQGDRAFLRDAEMAYRPAMPGRDDADWGQPSYLTHPPSHLTGQTYPAHLPSAAPDTLSSGSPDSGHLLGAAGLGLIGGIALAGVLAVFVFNSFVPENDPVAPDPTPKVVERLTPPTAENAPPVRIEVPAPAAPQPAAAVPVVRPALTPSETPRPVAEPQPEPPGQKLAARDANGSADGPIKLDIRVADASDKDESLISLKGLPPEARLSTGIDVGGGQWLLPPARLRDLSVTLPKGTSGEFGLEVQLLKDDAQTSLSDPISFDLRVTPKRQDGSAVVAPSNTGAAPAGTEQVSRLAVLPDETPQIETDFLTQMLIRDGNRLMRDGDIASARRLYEQAAANGNAEAALAMGRSYDPSYFEKLPVKTGKPDPATAFEWYKRALEGGLVTARVKIDALKQWLQR